MVFGFSEPAILVFAISLSTNHSIITHMTPCNQQQAYNCQIIAWCLLITCH